jgi:hypothetical protein
MAKTLKPSYRRRYDGASWLNPINSEREGEMKAFRVLLLVLTLSVCTYAGEMDNGRAGDMPYGKDGNIPCDKTGTPDVVTTITLQLLQSVLPLF